MTKQKKEVDIEGRKKYFTDIDRMVNEGLGGGYVSEEDENALIGESVPLAEESKPTLNGEK